MRPILLIHGLFGTLSAPMIRDAFGGRTLVTPDLLGYGQWRDHHPADWSLAEQADHVARQIRAAGLTGPVAVVGHSVGGAVAVLLAARHPDLVASLTSVEGNCTLGDAFWSQRIAATDLPAVAAEVAGFRADVAGWIGGAVTTVTPELLEIATQWLDVQPASTIRAQARAVVSATAAPGYLETVRGLLDRGLPIHLLAGERSQSGWCVPDWVRQRAASDTVMAGCGHVMMLEDPQGFANAVLQPLCT